MPGMKSFRLEDEDDEPELNEEAFVDCAGSTARPRSSRAAGDGVERRLSILNTCTNTVEYVCQFMSCFPYNLSKLSFIL